MEKENLAGGDYCFVKTKNTASISNNTEATKGLLPLRKSSPFLAALAEAPTLIFKLDKSLVRYHLSVILSSAFCPAHPTRYRVVLRSCGSGGPELELGRAWHSGGAGDQGETACLRCPEPSATLNL